MGEPYLVWSYRLSQILGAVEHPNSDSPDALEIVRQICDRFHRVVIKLRGQSLVLMEKLRLPEARQRIENISSLSLIGEFCKGVLQFQSAYKCLAAAVVKP
jgi:hypothetical protein